MINLFLNNLFVLLCVLSPFFSFLLVKLSFLNTWRWFIVCELSFSLLSAFILFCYDGYAAHTIPSILIFYPISVLLFNLVFTMRFGVKKFAKVLSLSLMLGFILTELHEFPVFIFTILGIYGGHTYLVWFLPQIYLLVVGYLVVKLGGLHLSWKPIALFLSCLALLFLFYFFDPLIDIVHPPSSLAYLKRIFCFLIFTGLFTFWGDINEDQ